MLANSRPAAKLLLILHFLVATCLLFLGVATLLIGVLFGNDPAGSSDSALISWAGISLSPFILAAVTGQVAVVFFREQKYTQTIVTSAVFFASVVCAVVAFKIQAHREIFLKTQLTTPPAGFLMPTANSLPNNWVEAGHDYTNGGYEINYTLAGTSRPMITIGESTASYDDKVKQFTGSPASNESVRHFVYNNKPGALLTIIYASEPDKITYKLAWDDDGKVLTLDFPYVNRTDFSADEVIEILERLKRS